MWLCLLMEGCSYRQLQQKPKRAVVFVYPCSMLTVQRTYIGLDTLVNKNKGSQTGFCIKQHPFWCTYADFDVLFGKFIYILMLCPNFYTH